MSVVVGIMECMDQPLPSGWEVATAPLPAGVRGLCDYTYRQIWIADGLHPWQRRATVLHEIIHAERGPALVWHEAREERQVNRETARRLIPIQALGEVMQGTQDPRTAAAWLEVPVSMIWARIQGLHPSERAYLKRALKNHPKTLAKEKH